MPPYTDRWIDQVRRATEDDAVAGVLLSVDSPGGLVADSHQIYHELQKLASKKPIFVAMKRLAASGGYYVAMGAGIDGRIFVEPTTWTGSIGVIIPRYNARDLAEKVGVFAEPLTTGPLKDTLSPFRDITEQEREVWDAIIKDSFDRFVGVIAENRPKLDEEAVRTLATGQIYTASQAIESGLVDLIGYEEDAIKALAERTGASDYQVVEYRSDASIFDLLLGASAKQPSVVEQLLDAAVPRALYHCSWNPIVPGAGF
ncbi:MAG: signal peptide peptidase SppA [Planctomycetaceae bacterium]|nr:signal peptide peptidase SppA [Planctomycetaceae bacterium]